MAMRKAETIEGRECEVAKPVCRLCEGKRLRRYGMHVQMSLFLVSKGFAAEARGGLELSFLFFPSLRTKGSAELIGSRGFRWAVIRLQAISLQSS